MIRALVCSAVRCPHHCTTPQFIPIAPRCLQNPEVAGLARHVLEQWLRVAVAQVCGMLRVTCQTVASCAPRLPAAQLCCR